MSMQQAAPAATRNISLSDVQSARDELEAKLLAIVAEFEQQYGCQITNLWCDGTPRTTAVRASVHL